MYRSDAFHVFGLGCLLFRTQVDRGMMNNVCTRLGMVACVLALTACDDTAVEYSLSCSRVQCPNASDTSSFTSSTGARAFTCTWDCADYLGNDDAYVSLTFWNDGGCWALESEFVAGGICGY